MMTSKMMQPMPLPTDSWMPDVGLEKMMKNMKRAQRRHDRKRMQKRAERITLDFNYEWYSRHMDAWHESACKLRDNLKDCSCYACRNQRHNDWQNDEERMTMQERKALDEYREEIKEIDA